MTDDEYLNRKGEVWCIFNNDSLVVNRQTELNDDTTSLEYRLRCLNDFRNDYFLTKEAAEEEAQLRRIQRKLKE